MDNKVSFIGKLFDMSFSNFITINIMSIMYVICIILTCIAGLFMIFGGFMQGGFMGGIGGIIIAAIIVPLGVIFSRVNCEMILVLFRIAENTKKD